MDIFFDSNVGKRRGNNEDSVKHIIFADDMNLFMIADGVGGEKKGEVASELSTSNVEKFFVENESRLISSLNDEKKVREFIEDAIISTNKIVFDKAIQKEFFRMASTLVLAFIHKDKAYIANVGDSRCYIYRTTPDRLSLITKDHTFVQELVEGGIINIDEARNHNEKHIITRAVGIEEDLRVDFFIDKLEKSDTLLLCSDGLTDMVDDYTIRKSIIQNSTSKETVESLIQTALEKGGIDNITVLCAKTGEVK